MWVASGREEEVITPQERMVGAVTLGGMLLIVTIAYAMLVSAYPNTIPLQAGDLHNIPTIDEPPTPVSLKYLGETYKVPGRELTVNYKITNTGKEALRVGEFISAGLRFLNPDVYTAKVSKPA
jgi:methane/ammonia monooxygenase subunit B